MQNLKELIEIDDRLQPHLLQNDYSFIGPSDPELLKYFIEVANKFAPVVALSRKLRHVLGNKQASRKALQFLPGDALLRIYVVDGKTNDLIHDTVEGYCLRKNIDLS